tara:strand:- start:1100 stop:1282 length:183 start_codon:yes stop_codon:yes gene_type:complete
MIQGLTLGSNAAPLSGNCLNDDEWDRRVRLTTPMSADRQTNQFNCPFFRRLEMKWAIVAP